MRLEAIIAVVIPTYKVKQHILGVIHCIPSLVQRIYVVDDCCPEGSGKYVEENVKDSRVRVLYHSKNKGVGGAVLTGYQAAYKNGASVIVKLDGDGQMDPSLIFRFIRPILLGQADYTKGNRFYDITGLSVMPKIRLFGNAALSLVNKLSSGYWTIMDPTNGYTAIHANLIPLLPGGKIAQRYFFESDMLFRLNILRAVVKDIPMEAKYADEKSNLRISNVLVTFPRQYLVCFVKRIFYNYFLREFNMGSVQIVGAILFTLYGAAYGFSHWLHALQVEIPAASGVVMAAALPSLIGFQLLLAAINYDVSNDPKTCIHTLMDQGEQTTFASSTELRLSPGQLPFDNYV